MKHLLKWISAVVTAAAIVVQPVCAFAETDVQYAAEERLEELNSLALDADDCDAGVYGIEISDEDAEYLNSVILSDYADSEEGYVDSVETDLSTATTQYFYVQLSDEEKKMYNDLYAACERYLASSVDFSTQYTEYVSRPSSVDNDRLAQIINLFYYSNPQFFFATNGYSYSSVRVAVLVADGMQKYSTRKKYGDALEDITNTVIAGASGMTDDLEIETYIYEYLVDRIDYVKTGYHQTIAGALVDGKCVCNGYTMSMAYFCNALGLDTVSIVGQNHAWNRVKLYDKWYETDVTWMDQGKVRDIWYKWCNKSHDTILAQDKQHNSNAHTVRSSYYIDLTLPECLNDTVEKPAVDRSLKINAENFPDAVFRNYIAANFDKDGSGTLSDSEIAAVTSINVSEMGISDLTGVGYFTGLKNLNCSINNIASIDLSKNTALTALRCFGNRLTALDVSANTALESLYCGTNQLTALNVAKNPALIELSAYENKIASLDLSKNPDIYWLSVFDNKLTSLDVRGIPALKYLYFSNNKVGAIDVSKNPLLECLGCENNNITSLDVSKNPGLLKLRVTNNGLTSIDLRNNTKLEELKCDNNSISAIDVSNNTELATFLCGGNKLTSLDISSNTKLQEFSADNNQFTIKSASLNGLSGFNGAMASGWTGASYNSRTNNIYDIRANTVTYDYSVGQGKTVTFTLILDGVTEPALEKPAVTAAAGNGKVTLTWNAVDGATNYGIYKYENGKYTRVGGTKDTSFIWTGLTNGVTYKVLVRAMNSAVGSAYSTADLVSVTPVGGPANTASDFEWDTFYEGDKEECSIYGYKGTAADVIIPEEINGKPVSYIAGGAFRNSNITSVYIPDTVTRIDNLAFDGCSSLKTVRMPQKSVIGYKVFRECSSLGSITIPDGTEIEDGEYAFLGCSSLETVILPSGLEKIGRSMFEGCDSLKNIVIPDTVREIEYAAFYGCNSLEEIDIPASVEKIGNRSFYNCGLKRVKVRNGAADIAVEAFSWHDGDDGMKIDHSLVMCGEKGSSAEKIARRNGLIFETLDGSEKTDHSGDIGCTEATSAIFDAAIDYLNEYYIEKYPDMALEPFFTNEQDHKKLIAVARTIAEENSGRSIPMALYDWMIDNIDIYSDAEYGYPIDVYNYKCADCFGSALLLCELLRCSDIPAVVMSGYTGDMANVLSEPMLSTNTKNGKRLEGHEWVMYYYEGEWQLLDSVWQRAFSDIKDMTRWYYISDVDEVAVTSEYLNTSQFLSDLTRQYKDGAYLPYSLGSAEAGSHVGLIYPENVFVNTWGQISTLIGEENSEDGTNYPGKGGWYVGDHGYLGYLKKNGNLSVQEIRKYNGRNVWIGQNSFVFDINVLDPSRTYMGIPVVEKGTTISAGLGVGTKIVAIPNWELIGGNADIGSNGTFTVNETGGVNIEAVFPDSAYDPMLSVFVVDSEPYQISGLSGKAVSDGVKISWNAVDNASGYVVKRLIDGEWVDAAVVDGDTTEFVVKGLAREQKYTFAVDVYADHFRYVNDSDVSVNNTVTKPAVTAEPTYGGAEVTWEPVNGAVNYRVYTFVPGGKIRQFGSDTKDTSMTVKGLKGGEKTGIIVLAQFANKKWSKYTDEDIVYVVPKDAVKPYLCVNPKGNGKYYLIWSSVPTSVRYKVMAREKGTNNWELIGATRKRCRIMVEMDPNKQYDFLVRGLNARNKYTPMDADDIVAG